MSFTESAPTTETTPQFAYCSNAGNCSKAAAGETIEWYRGPGEYCPECGEALAVVDVTPRRTTSAVTPPASAAASGSASAAGSASDTAVPNSAAGSNSGSASGSNAASGSGSASGSSAAGSVSAPTVKRRLATSVPTAPPAPSDLPGPVPVPKRASSTKVQPPPRWLYLAGALIVAIVALGYMLRRGAEVGGKPAAALALCAAPSAAHLASDLVRAYALKTGQSADAFVISDGGSCSVRFGTVAETPDAAIARDGIVVVVNPDNAIGRVSETQLRGIFSGAIRDWSQLGGKPGPIVAMLPEAGTDEAKALESSLFFGMPVDTSVTRRATSADVTRAITGADRTSHQAIGLVVFSQAVTAKVVPIAYLPPPNVISIGARTYPYTLTVAVQTAPGRANPAASRFVEFARSRDGAAVVAKDGLVPREDL